MRKEASPFHADPRFLYVKKKMDPFPPTPCICISFLFFFFEHRVSEFLYQDHDRTQMTRSELVLFWVARAENGRVKRHEAGPIVVYTHKPTAHVAGHKRSR